MEPYLGYVGAEVLILMVKSTKLRQLIYEAWLLMPESEWWK